MSDKRELEKGLSLLKEIDTSITKIDATNPDNLSKKVLPEVESRRRILSHARQVGMEKDMLILFAKYDKLLRNCTNERERADIGKMGAYEVYRILGGGGELYIGKSLDSLQLVAKDD